MDKDSAIENKINDEVLSDYKMVHSGISEFFLLYETADVELNADLPRLENLFYRSQDFSQLKRQYILERVETSYCTEPKVESNGYRKGYRIEMSFIVDMPINPEKFFWHKQSISLKYVPWGFIVVKNDETVFYRADGRNPKYSVKIYDPDKKQALIKVSMSPCGSPQRIRKDLYDSLTHNVSFSLLSELSIWMQDEEKREAEAREQDDKKSQQIQKLGFVGNGLNANFDYQFYLSTLRTADAAELPMAKKDDLARAMAILYADQGGNEQMTHSYKLMAEIQFAQEKYRILGGEKPDPKFALLLKRYIREIEIYQEQLDGFPDWAVRLMDKRYGIKID